MLLAGRKGASLSLSGTGGSPEAVKGGPSASQAPTSHRAGHTGQKPGVFLLGKDAGETARRKGSPAGRKVGGR